MTDDLRNLPDPLVPADVDLTGLTFMPMQLRILSSTLFAKSSPAEFKAAFALWCASWHERPAATLPDDPVMLAFLARVDAETWASVSTWALHGWTRRSDGRLHHEILAPLALSAWEKREEFREIQNDRETRQKRWRDKVKRLTAILRECGIAAPRGSSLEKLLALCAKHVPGFDADAETNPVDGAASTTGRAEMAKRVRGTVKGEKRERKERGTGNTGVSRAAENAPEPAAKAPRKRAADTTESRGARLPETWVLPQPWGVWALEKYPHWSPELVRELGVQFRNHWVGKSGKDATKLDWHATWQNWCMSAITQRDHPPPGKAGTRGRPTQADVDHATKESARLLFGDDPDSGQSVTTIEQGAIGHG